MRKSTPPILTDITASPRVLTCECLQCKGQIEFDAAGIKSDEVVSLECPNCHAETTATIPPTEDEIEHAKHERARLEAQQVMIQQVMQVKESLRARLQSGKPVFLYDSVFVPVDSVLNQESLADKFDLTILRQLGLAGWDIVQAVPKTIGVALTNTSFGSSMGETWGAGIGGNVMGVHVIIKKSLSFSDLTDDLQDEVGQFILSHLQDFYPH